MTKTTVGDFCPFIYGRHLPSGDRRQGPVPVYGSNGIIGWHDRALTNGPTVIIGRKGTVGQVRYSPVSCWPIDTTFYVEASAERDVRFVYFLLSALGLETMNSDSAVPGLNRDAAHSRSILVPRIAEQRVIADILGTLDDKIELNRRMNETLESMARALFKSWFIDFDAVRAKAEGRDPGLPADIISLFPDSFEDSDLGEIPKGWTLGVLDQLVDRVLGGDWGADEETDETSESVRCIRGADIPDLQTGGTGKMPVRFLKRTSLEKRRLSDGDVVVEISGGSPTQSTGRPVLVSSALLGRLDMPLVCSNFCRLMKLKSPALSKFVYLWLRSLYANDEFLQFENGTTGIKNLAFTRFSSNYKLCIPPLQVLEAFDKQVSPLFERQQAAAGETDTLSTLCDTLLPKLLSGEIRLDDITKTGGINDER